VYYRLQWQSCGREVVGLALYTAMWRTDCVGLGCCKCEVYQATDVSIYSHPDDTHRVGCPMVHLGKIAISCLCPGINDRELIARTVTHIPAGVEFHAVFISVRKI
jgi:hypothetical protein